MKPDVTSTHADFQAHVLNYLREYHPGLKGLSQSKSELIAKFYALDLSAVDHIMADRYSVFGPRPRSPACMLRSYLLSLELGVHSITAWVDQMSTVPLYAVLSGFDPDDIPGIGTFYDFFRKIWNIDNANMNPHIKPKNKSVTKPEKKGAKAPPNTRKTVRELIEELRVQSFSSIDEPYGCLFEIFSTVFLGGSVERGLVDLKELTLAGDGTPVQVSARLRRRKICDCTEKGILHCDCDRYYSQPDCDVGWDSSREYFYNGYDLYILTDAQSQSDLPIFPLLNPASMHDSLGFLHTFFRMKNLLPQATISNLLLDSAHDAMPYYEYCLENDITPFIDLNGNGTVQQDDITLDKDGRPICPAGKRMIRDGCEKDRKRIKFRCPKAWKGHPCSCETPCSETKYGRVTHLYTADNPRMINIPARGSRQWKDMYRKRTSSERTNKRIKNDYKLEDGRHRSSRMWYCRLYCIMMLQHLNAWSLEPNTQLVS